MMMMMNVGRWGMRLIQEVVDRLGEYIESSTHSEIAVAIIHFFVLHAVAVRAD